LKTKNTIFGIFWRALGGEMLVYFLSIRNILLPFGIFVVIGYFSSCFGLLLEKNLATVRQRHRRTRSIEFGADLYWTGESGSRSAGFPPISSRLTRKTLPFSNIQCVSIGSDPFFLTPVKIEMSSV
jgi:hypothetical protein